MSGHGYGESLSDFSHPLSNLVIERNREILESVLNPEAYKQEIQKKRKVQIENAKEEEPFVKIDAWRFLDLHYHQLLYAQSGMENASQCFEEAKKDEKSERISQSLTNAANYMVYCMKEVAEKSFFQISQTLEDKPKFRGRYVFELLKCETLIEKIINKKFVWKTEAIKPKYDHVNDED